MSSSSAKSLPTFREPFTIDVVNRFLDKIPFSAPFLLLLPALTYLYDQHSRNLPLTLVPASDQLLPRLRSLLFTEYRWVGYAWVFTLVKTVNRTLNRYVRNHGQYRRDPIRYDRDVIVITGGSAGIGKEIVQLLSHRKGATVAVLDMGAPTYLAAPKGKPEILYFKTDVSNPDQVAEAARQIRQRTGKKVGALINCAGIASGNTILDVDLASAARVWRVNTLSNWVTCQQFLPDLIAANHGHVVTVSSSGAYASLPSMSEYATSKAAALAFHEVLSIELRTRYSAPRVRTTLVAPTKVRTALGDGMEDHTDPFFTPVLEPVQVARQIVGALDSGLSQHIMTPHFANLLPWLRALPDCNGYGANWEGEDKALYEKRRLAHQQQATKK
ncbi:related to retinal short-chain dehydrogenase/reductase [Pseudozyma flocculosa]|uniref:Short-chain dehydrogenase/reductase 3 n=1 Tax=Pseudozyma flocculosa TaxID=84751 RepID=A0A5C3FD11_9BASI|nr:related to retinal short-chain dehydrogenase/reductase [Pseudozyma flocculosa]